MEYPDSVLLSAIEQSRPRQLPAVPLPVVLNQPVESSPIDRVLNRPLGSPPASDDSGVRTRSPSPQIFGLSPPDAAVAAPGAPLSLCARCAPQIPPGFSYAVTGLSTGVATGIGTWRAVMGGADQATVAVVALIGLSSCMYCTWSAAHLYRLEAQRALNQQRSPPPCQGCYGRSLQCAERSCLC